MRVVTTLVLLLALAFAISSRAQTGKKVYISVDLEGISGINGDDQTSAGQPEYARGRKLMVEDANAAIRGAFAGGATDVLVNDSHGSQRNLLPEDLDPRARLISHSFKRYGMMEGLDETFDSVLFIGYHARASAPRGLFAHTGSGVVRDLQVNGVAVGEGGMNAALAAWYGVAVALVTGDDTAVDEVKAIVPSVKGVVVKRAINTRAVETAAAGRSAAAHRSRREGGGGGGEEAGADPHGPLPRVDAVSRRHDSRGDERVPGDGAAGARHARLRAAADARGLSPHPRALPLHQHQLIRHAVTSTA